MSVLLLRYKSWLTFARQLAEFDPFFTFHHFFIQFFVPFGKEKEIWLGWNSNPQSINLKPIPLTLDHDLMAKILF